MFPVVNHASYPIGLGKPGPIHILRTAELFPVTRKIR